MVIKNYDFKDELSKNFVNFLVKKEGEFITGVGEHIIFEREMYELYDINLVAIIKNENYDKWYKKIEKYSVIDPDLILVGKIERINGLISRLKKEKVNLEEYNGEKHNEDALERRFKTN